MRLVSAIEVKEAYLILGDAINALRNAEIVLSEKEQELRDAEARAILIGVDGKNEAARNALLRDIVRAERAARNKAAKDKILAQMEYERAKLKVNRNRDLIGLGMNKI